MVKYFAYAACQESDRPLGIKYDPKVGVLEIGGYGRDHDRFLQLVTLWSWVGLDRVEGDPREYSIRWPQKNKIRATIHWVDDRLFFQGMAQMREEDWIVEATGQLRRVMI